MCVCGRTCLHLVVVLELKLEMDLSRFFAYFPDQLAMFPPPPNSFRKKEIDKHAEKVSAFLFLLLLLLLLLSCFCGLSHKLGPGSSGTAAPPTGRPR